MYNREIRRQEVTSDVYPGMTLKDELWLLLKNELGIGMDEEYDLIDVHTKNYPIFWKEGSWAEAIEPVESVACYDNGKWVMVRHAEINSELRPIIWKDYNFMELPYGEPYWDGTQEVFLETPNENS